MPAWLAGALPVGGLRFAAPAVLAAFVLLSPFAFWWWRRRPRPSTLAVADLALIAAAASAGGASWRLRLRWLPGAFRAAAIALAVIALARPQRAIGAASQPLSGIDVMLVLDISNDMNEATWAAGPQPPNAPSKFVTARSAFEDFAKQLPGSRVGLVAFQSQAITLSPLTTDHTALVRELEQLTTSPGWMPDGTAIGTALLEALNQLRNSSAASRVIVVGTAGENDGQVAVAQSTQVAQTLGVRIYPFDVQDADDKVGGDDPDEVAMHTMATATGGTWHNVDIPGEADKAYQEIDALKASHVADVKFAAYQELAPELAAAVAVLLVAEALLSATLLRRYP